jgi:DNA modification methylase
VYQFEPGLRLGAPLRQKDPVWGQANRGDAVARAAHLETGVIHCADNLAAMRLLPGDSVDLIYLDPPFFSNKTYEVIWGDEAEVRSFEDRWEGGINVYINWMRERVVEMHRVLKPTGVLFLHCDWHASHYIKCMLDTVFGSKRFLNEIAWCYRGGGVSKRFYARKHDTIFFYAKGKTHFFEPQFVPYSEATLKRVGKKGLRVNLTEIDADRGAHMPDWWTDLNALQTYSPERLGYPTQKPEALLERIIQSASPPGAVILDPFCGCGTAIAVAEKLKRRWIGMDISPTAVGIMERRLAKLGATVRLFGLPMTEDDLKNLKPFEFQNWVIQRVDGTHSPRKSGDMGIDGYSFMEGLPIQVKQSERVGRNVVDNFETAVERAGHSKGYVIAFSFTRGAREEAARVKTTKGMSIELVEVSRLAAAPERRYPQLEDLFPKIRESFLDMPLPASRPKKSRPTVEELIRSDRAKPIPGLR